MPPAASRSRRRRRQPLTPSSPTDDGGGDGGGKPENAAAPPQVEGTATKNGRGKGAPAVPRPSRRVAADPSVSGCDGSGDITVGRRGGDRPTGRVAASSSTSRKSRSKIDDQRGKAGDKGGDARGSKSRPRKTGGRRRRVAGGGKDGADGGDDSTDSTGGHSIMIDDDAAVFDSNEKELSARASGVLAALKGANAASGEPIASSRLLSAIASGSACFKGGRSGGRGGITADMESSLLLDERLSEVLSAARKCVRSATRKDPGAPSLEVGKKVALLRVSVHSLRAVMPLLLSDSGGNDRRKDAEGVIKLLYYITTTAGDVCVACRRETGKGNEGGGLATAIESATTCLAAYEALGSLLCEVFSLHTPNINNDTEGGACRHGNIYDVFPLASLESAAVTGGNTLPWKQITKIGVQCIFSALSVLSTVPWDRLKQSGGDCEKSSVPVVKSIENEFGSHVVGWLDLDGKWEGTSAAQLQGVARFIAAPWILTILAGSDDTSGECSNSADGIKDVLSHAKRLHRLLWDAASTVDKVRAVASQSNHCAMRRLALSLRGDAVLAMLLWRFDPEKKQWINPMLGSKGGRGLTMLARQLGKQLESIASLAWKAAASFTQSSNLAPYGMNSEVGDSECRDRKALFDFHGAVGGAFDSLFDCSDCKWSTSYLEYCAYRALHIGPSSKRRCDSNRSLEHSQSGKENCNPADTSTWSQSKLLAQDKGTERLCLGRPRQEGDAFCPSPFCAFAHLPFCFRHECDYCCCNPSAGGTDEPGKIRSTNFVGASGSLAIVFVVIQSKFETTDTANMEKTMSLADTVISNFRHNLLDSSIENRSAQLDGLMRCQKLLALLKLNTAAFTPAKRNDKEGSIELACLDVYRAIIIGRVLGECYAPLCALIAYKQGIDASALYLKMASDGYVRAATLLYSLQIEKQDCSNGKCSIDEAHEENRVEKSGCIGSLLGASALRERLILHCHKFACGLQKDVSGHRNHEGANHIEMVAKGLVGIARRQFEAGNGTVAVLPLAIACDVLTLLFESGRVESALTSSRYHAYAASIFQSIGFIGHASASLAISIRDQLVVASVAEDTSSSAGKCDSDHAVEYSLLKCVGSLAPAEKGTQCTSSMPSLPLTRLASLCLRDIVANADRQHTATSGCPPAEIELINKHTRLGDLVSNSRIVSDDDGRHIVSLPRLLEELILTSEKSQITFTHKMAMVREMILCLGSEGNRTLCRNPNIEDGIISSEFEQLLQKAFFCIETNQMKPDLALKYRAALNTSAALVMMSPKSSLSGLNRPQENALHYARAALVCLSSIRNTSSVLLSVQRTLAGLLVAQNSEQQRGNAALPDSRSCFESLLNDCVEATNQLHTATFDDDPALFAKVLATLFYCASQLQAALDLDGTVIPAACAAALTLRICHLDKTLGGMEPWVLSYAHSVLIEAGFLQMTFDAFVSYASNDKNDIPELEDDKNDIPELEAKAVNLFSQVRKSLPDQMEILIQVAIELLSVVEQKSDTKGENNSTSPQHWLEAQWVSTTLFVLLSEAEEKQGHLNISLGYLKNCCHTCRKALSFARRYVANETFPPRFLHRLSSCLSKGAMVYARLGDNRKAEAYAINAIETLSVEIGKSRLSSKRTAAEIVSLLGASHRSRHSDCQRNYVYVKSLSMPPDAVADEVSLHLTNGTTTGNEFDSSIEQHLSLVKDFTSRGDLIELGSEAYARDRAFCFDEAQSQLRLLLEAARSCAIQKIASCLPVSVEGVNCKAQPFEQIQCEIDLRLMSMNDERQSKICYREILSSPFATTTCRASAHYQLGILALQAGRESNELCRLWLGHAYFVHNREAPSHPDTGTQSPVLKHLPAARYHFEQACKYGGPPSHILSRHAMRCLALVTGPDSRSIIANEPGYAASTLIHSSIGSSARQLTSRARPTTTVCGKAKHEYHSETFSALDAPFDREERNAAVASMYEEASQILPNKWNFVAVALCPTGEVLMSSILFSKGDVISQTICIFPGVNHVSSSRVFEEVLGPLDSIIEASQQQLTGMDPAAAKKLSSDEAKRKWWNDRKSADENLSNLVEQTEQAYFSSTLVKGLLGRGDCLHTEGRSAEEGNTSESDSETSELSCGNLASRFEAACKIDEECRKPKAIDKGERTEEANEEKALLNKKTVVQLKNELLDYGIEKKSLQKLRKAALVDLLFEIVQRERQLKLGDETMCSSSSDTSTEEEPDHELTSDHAEDPCIFLILDENFHRFPFENMTLLKEKAVSRLPSISFAVEACIQDRHSGKKTEANAFAHTVDPVGASFVVDPQANLIATKNTMLGALNSFSKDHGLNWDGVAGEYPSMDFMERALTRERGLFLYCGHGGGENFFGRSQIETRLLQSRRRCRATVILMGCSSGRLISVNSKGSKSREMQGSINKKSYEKGHCTMFYEPDGTVMSYLSAGAPCVVGNLWDVTDRDIDKYCIELLGRFLGTSDDGPDSRRGQSIPQCVSKARSVCKMQSIVGFAPVCYGIPVRCAPH